MGTWRKSLLLGLAAFIALLPVISHAQSANREVARTFANFYLQKGDYSSAQDSLMSQLTEDSEDSAAWNLLGLTYFQTAQPQTARRAFEKALANAASDEPIRGVYLYNEADALVRMGEVSEAAKVLKIAADFPLVGVNAKRALKGLKAHEALPPLDVNIAVETRPDEKKSSSPSSGRTSLDLFISAGYDTNVSLMSDSLASVLTTNQSSPQMSVSAALDHRRELFGLGFTPAAAFAYTYYMSESVRTLNSLYGSASADFGGARGSGNWFFWGVGNHFETTFLNLSGFGFYDWINSVRARFRARYLGASSVSLELPLRYQKFAESASQSAADRRGGWGLRPTLVHRHEIAGFFLSEGVEFERHFAQGENFRALSLGVPLGVSKKIPWNMVSSLGLGFTRIWYPESASARQDSLAEASLGFSRPVFGDGVATLSYQFKRNYSNVEGYVYNKHLLSLMVSYGVL